EEQADARAETYEFGQPASLGNTASTSWGDTSLAPAVQDGRLDLGRVTPDMVRDLTPQQRRELTDQLKGQELEYLVRAESFGHGTRTEPADRALARSLVTQAGGGEAAAQLFAANPEMLNPFLGHAANMAPGANADLVNAVAD